MLTALRWPDLSEQDVGSGSTTEGSAWPGFLCGKPEPVPSPTPPLCQKQSDRPGGKAGTWLVGCPGVTTGPPQLDSKGQQK